MLAHTDGMVMKNMDRLTTSCVLGELIEQYVRSAMDGDRDCRLLVPGLTREIARQVHHYLLEQGVNSYLVIGVDEEPSETDHLIRAVGLTSKRIGSFVSIASPGQLVHIQDSIRGSGGTIRSLAFSEEWPWIDNGSEPFRFDGPVLEALVQRWSNDVEEQDWLREFVLDALLEHTRSSSKRAHILLEDILGSFDPGLYPEVTGIREKLLYHAGVPRPSGALPAVQRLVRDTARLCQRIVGRCRKEEDVREQARDMVIEVVEESERDNTRFSLDRFLDGIGGSTTLDLDMLAFYGCWGPDRNDSSHWRRLHAERLADLFGARDREKAELSYNIECQRGIIADGGKKLATFIGEQVELDVAYRIPADQFAAGHWLVRVLNRQRVVLEQVLAEPEGDVHLEFDTANSTNNYSRKIPLRVALVTGNDVETYERLDLHLCGEDRPAFTVVDPAFEVVDAAPANEEETPDKKLTVDEPVHLFLFSRTEQDVALYDENDEEIGLTEIAGVWRSAQRVDVSAEPSGLAIRVCKFGALTAVLCFETSDLERGEFTVEDELRVAISGGREKRLRDLIDLFHGKSDEPYPALGRIDEAARRRMVLAKLVTARMGWRPLLTNLLVTDHQSSGSLGDFVNYFGPVEGEAFQTLTFPEDALSLLKIYSDARDAVRQEVESLLGARSTSIEHPTYASHPVFVHERSPQMEPLLKNYLDAYRNILVYLQNKQKDLEWSQLFVLAHLDCVVHWDSSRLRNAFFLVGPWHPLVLAKRFMVQAALFSRAYRLLHEEDGKVFRHLSFLLGSVQGFRWVLGMSADDRLIEPAYASITSDPGWHLALKTNCPAQASQEEIAGLPGIMRVLRQNLGLAITVGAGGSNSLAVTCLANYLRAFPSRRSIGIRIRRGYTGSDIVRTVDSHIHDDEGATKYGQQLPGGVRLYFEEPLDNTGDARWTDPPLYVYRYEDDAECLREAHPDIYMLPPVNDLSFRTGTTIHELPRGRGREAVFSKRLGWLTEGHTQVPKSVTYEYDAPREGPDNIGGAFTNVTGQIGTILGDPVATVCDVALPQRLRAPWVVIPGHSIDPAIFVKYVRDGADRAIQERALWDYKLDVTGRENSYFVLSTIPKGFQIAVNGFFGLDDIAGDFIVELGRIGIAIGSEALRSGRHALGIIGLIGTVRLLVGKTNDGQAPLPCSVGTVGFLVPVDSFSSFFGKSGLEDGKRTDLLAVQLVLPGHGSSKLRISACGVESKLVSGAFGITRAHAALAQARTTGDEFKRLVLASLRQGAMPERLALVDILKFGLRITSPSKPGEIEGWVDRERMIYDAVLAGNYEYSEANHGAVLVSTEGRLPGVAEHIVLEEGLWVRLTKGHWPGISDTPQLESIRQALCKLFDIPGDSSPTTSSPPETPPATPSIPPGEEESEVPGASPSTEESGSEPEPDAAPPEETQAGTEPAEGEPGVPLDRIFIGVDDARSVVYFDPQYPVDPLDNMNVMVTGSSGKGKTQLLKYLVCQFREQGKNVLILDFKNDFISDNAFSNEAQLDRISVNFDGLPYNPLIPYPIRHHATGEMFIQPGQHIAGVASVLKRTFRLGDQQAAMLKSAMADSFVAAGAQATGTVKCLENNRFPDFGAVGISLQHDNIKAFNRLEPLFSLGLFRPECRAVSFHELTGRSMIIDLSQIPSDEIKNALAQLIVMSAHAYFNALPQSGRIRQLFVIDEAHRVLDYEFMADFVLQCRAYGVGMILSSQYPSQFPQDVSSSMATKILHGNERDSNRVKDIVKLIRCEGREGDVANLDRFQAFVDNRHYPHTLLRTMNYPLYLVWTRLRELGTATREELSEAEGFDPSKLQIGNLVRQLERLGLAEEREGRVFLLECK
ncbi:MAG: hypothetical protein E3J72_12235 [Planctomycetota bacterium]|nr:MAG: hypothetical protein E3J72_12235 [Planctomycetota bacterium]